MPSSESRQLNFALLVLRVACALPFLYHGSAFFLAFSADRTGELCRIHARARGVGYSSA